MKRVTIKEVAERAGVSVTTASFAINDVKGRVSKEAKEKVLAAVRELDYVPDRNAKSLRLSSSNTIMLVYSQSYLEEQNASTVKYILSVVQMARKIEKDVLIRTIRPAGDWEAAAESYANLWRSNRVDGIVFLCALDDRVPDQFFSTLYNKHDVNLVNVSFTGAQKDYPIVYIDEYSLTWDAMNYAVSKNYREIYYVVLDSNEDISQKTRAYKDYIAQNDVKGHLLSYHSIYRNKYDIMNLIRPILDEQHNDIAFVCWNDVDAISVLEAVQMLSAHPGYRIGVVGFDDLPTAQHTNPPLTTIRYPFDEIGYQCIQVLEEQKKHKNQVPPNIRVETQIIERESL